MTRNTFAALKREKDMLLNQYIKASSTDRVKILVKIMDIDEQLELFTSKAAV